MAANQRWWSHSSGRHEWDTSESNWGPETAAVASWQDDASSTSARTEVVGLRPVPLPPSGVSSAADLTSESAARFSVSSPRETLSVHTDLGIVGADRLVGPPTGSPVLRGPVEQLQVHHLVRKSVRLMDPDYVRQITDAMENVPAYDLSLIHI